MKYITFLFITLNFHTLFANQKEYTRIDVVFYTKTLGDAYDNHPSGRTIFQLMMSDHLSRQALASQRLIPLADSTIAPKFRYVGPYATDIEEDGSDDRDRNLYYAIKATLADPTTEFAQRIEQVKSEFDVKTVRIVLFITGGGAYTEAGSNIIVTGTRTPAEPIESFLTSVRDTTKPNTMKGYEGEYPVGHPLEGGRYYTFLSVSPTVNVFPKDGYHLDNHGWWIRIGDENHTVLNWNLSTIFNIDKSFGFATLPDTLTIQAGVERHIELYPGWNDQNVGKVLYTGGEIYNPEPLFTNELSARFYQRKTSTDDQLGAYAVAINDIEDAFAMDYILVKYVESLEIPTIDESSIPDSIRVGDEFTITLKGDTDKMTSWVPTFLASNENIELINFTQSSATFKAKSEGKTSIILSHKNALRQDIEDEVSKEITITDQTGSVNKEEISIYPNPTNGIINISTTTKIEIFDQIGTKRAEKIGKSINISELPVGIYYLQIGGTIHKIVKY